MFLSFGKGLAVCVTCLGISAYCFAGSKSEDAQKSAEGVIPALKKLYPVLDVREVNNTPVSGVQEITFGDGQIIYSLNGTRYFVKGELIKVSDTGMVNVTEEGRKTKRSALLSSLSNDEMIVFPAKGEKKAGVTVFTDTDCGYCRKFHGEVPNLNAMGIEVRYLAYPRGGLSSSTYTDLSSAWCASNRQESFNLLTERKSIPNKTCENNPVEAQYTLGNKIGVNATPATVLPDGSLLMGYRSANDWKEILGI